MLRAEVEIFVGIRSGTCRLKTCVLSDDTDGDGDEGTLFAEEAAEYRGYCMEYADVC